MKHYPYLIIGGGLTGDAAVRGIRELDAESAIGMVSFEPDPPYARPNLSKSLWKGRPVEKIWRNTQDLGAELYLGRKIVQLNPQGKSIHDDQENKYTYDKLLIATGGSPNQLPFGKENIIYYRDFQDYQRLRVLSEHKESFLVIGGGFIGSEIAAALTMVGKKVIMVFPEDAIGARVYPADLAHFINDYYQQQGVRVVAGETVDSIEQTGDRISVRTPTGRIFEVDGVVAGIGIHPNVELARQAGLKTENGITVDDHLRTSAPDIYAAGDVANFYHAALGKRVRVEHEDNALHMGKLAGRNMAGANEAYTHVPMFYSDLFELGYEAVGELNSKLETVIDWKEPFKKGVVYYLQDGRVRGVLLWNVWKKIPAARALLAKPGPFKSADLIGKL
ncbi:MAG: FAD-dependent oxidoreductase [Anaerolineaceae bacterium]|jgi:NADPH-dependent 2,4-dienoyl-CoA reductase/sulfur reductase-like enzyme|nr:FAD-dependent oxidoreductase [Anaerolineaceae bacterium]